MQVAKTGNQMAIYVTNKLSGVGCSFRELKSTYCKAATILWTMPKNRKTEKI